MIRFMRCPYTLNTVNTLFEDFGYVMQAEIQAGMKVTLFVTQTKEEGVTTLLPLTSIVEELTDQEEILIQIPTHRGYNFPLPREPVVMRFSIEANLYALQVRYEGRIERDSFTFARMKRLGPIVRHQMREHFRLLCSLPVTIERKITDGKQTKSHAGTGYALDISESGMMLSTDEAVCQDEKLTVSFDIGTQETLDCLVLRVDRDPLEEGRSRAGLKFIFRYKSQQSRIYKYVLRMQTERL